MKRFLSILVLALTMVTLSTAYADDRIIVNTQGNLTDAQKAQLAAEAQKLAADNAANVNLPAPTTKVEVVRQWVDIGTAVGSGLAASAKELGVAANDFAQSPVGRFTVFLIAWHFIGHTLLHVFFALLWFTVITAIFVWMYRRAACAKTVTYYNKGEGPNGARKIIKIEPKTIGENLGISMLLSVGVAVIIFVVMLCNL